MMRSESRMKKLLYVCAVALIAAILVHTLRNAPPSRGYDGTAIEIAFSEHNSNVQVEQNGRVLHILPDDLDGSKHQRFIVELPSGHTVLVSHNIDIAPRIDGLQKGEAVAFRGEYEWNEKGGVVHWTHHDPAGRHDDGWIDYRGKIHR
jgi:hypothetical protein